MKKSKALALLLATCIVFSNNAFISYAEEVSEENAVDATVLEEPVTGVPEATEETEVTEEDAEKEVEPAPEEVVENPDPTLTGVEEAEEEEEKRQTSYNILSSADEMTSYLSSTVEENTRLLVFTEEPNIEFFDALSCVYYNGMYALTFDTAEKASEAKSAYEASGYVVEIDTKVQSHPDEDITEEVAKEEVDVELPKETIEEVAKQTEKEISKEELPVENEITVAIIDSGLDKENELLKDRLSDKTSESIADSNGHGTVMAEIIASNTAENVKLLPIAAFDEEGSSTVGKVYLAIEEAIASDADIINISASGLGNSKALEYAITDAKNADITVITAAGNDAAETKNYMPAYIPDVITVSAVNEDMSFAEYSNYGEEVDFCANGTLVKDMGTEDVSDDVVYRGTSVSCAYVSAYTALLLSNNKDADVYESLKQSAKDLGDEGFDNYYGFGYLSKDNIVAIIKESLEKEKEEISEEDREKALEEEKDKKLWLSLALKRYGFDTCIFGNINGLDYINDPYYNSSEKKLYISDGVGLIHIGTHTPHDDAGKDIEEKARTEGKDTGQVSFAHKEGYGYQVDNLTISDVVFEKPVEAHTNTYIVFKDCVFYGGISINTFNNANRPDSRIEFNNCTFYKGCGGQYSGTASCVAVHDEGYYIFNNCKFSDEDKGFAYDTLKLPAVSVDDRGESHDTSTGALIEGTVPTFKFNNCTSETSWGLFSDMQAIGNVANATDAVYSIVSVNGTKILNATVNPGISLYGGSQCTIDSLTAYNNDRPVVNYQGNLVINKMDSYNNTYGVVNYSSASINDGAYYNNTSANILNGNWEVSQVGIVQRLSSGTMMLNKAITSGGDTNVRNDGGTLTVGQNGQSITCSNAKNGIVNTNDGTALIYNVTCNGNSNVGILNSNGTMTIYKAYSSNNTVAGIGNDCGSYANTETDQANLIIENATCTNNGIGVYNYSNINNEKRVYPGVTRIKNIVATNNTIGIKNSSYLYFENGTLNNTTNNIANVVQTEAGKKQTGTAYVSGGTLMNSSVSLNNDGVLYLTGGMILKANCGLSNNGSASISKTAQIVNNTRAIYQNGTGFNKENAIDIYGNVNITGEVYLTKGHYINIPSELAATSKMNIQLANDDKDTGRSLVYTYNEAKNELSNFKLAFLNVNDTHKETTYDKDNSVVAAVNSPVVASVRAGVATNAPTNQLILSGAYYANYTCNFNGVDITFDTRYTLHFWNEHAETDTKKYATDIEKNKPKIYITKNDGSKVDVSKSFTFKGWSLSPDGSTGIYTTDQMLLKTGDFNWYAIVDISLNLYFDGNKQLIDAMRSDAGKVSLTGENFVIPNISMDDPIPANEGPDGTERAHFKASRIYTGTWYDVNMDKYIDYELPYAWAGWSLYPDGKNAFDPRSNDANTFGAVMSHYGIGGTTVGTDTIIAWIKNGTLPINDGMASATLYAVYNEYPIIKAYDIYITKADISSTDWLKDVVGTDKEDGILPNGTSVVVYNMSTTDLNNIGDKGEFTITYKATDKNGNDAFYAITVHITDNTVITKKEKDPSGTTTTAGNATSDYIRRIDEINYKKGTLAAGGLEKNSIWKKEDEYVELITTAFKNQKNDTPLISYTYKQADVKEMHDYMIANYNASLNEDYQSNFYTKFCKTHVKSGSLD